MTIEVLATAQVQTYEQYEAETLAIYEGRACELWICDQCGTQQGVAREVTHKGNPLGFDGGIAMELRCGHWMV